MILGAVSWVAPPPPLSVIISIKHVAWTKLWLRYFSGNGVGDTTRVLDPLALRDVSGCDRLWVKMSGCVHYAETKGSHTLHKPRERERRGEKTRRCAAKDRLNTT